MSNYEIIRTALIYIPAHEREVWLKMGMAIKSELGNEGFSLWDEWSQHDPSYNPKDAHSVWNSIDAQGGISIKTLFFEAKKYGFKSPKFEDNSDLKKGFVKFNGISSSSTVIDPHKKEMSILKTWGEGRTITKGDPVDQYLRTRGLTFDNYPNELRCHPRLGYYENGVLLGYYPAMIALIKDINSKNVSIHRTYLDNGEKANVAVPKKLMFGGITGAAIRLFEPINGKLAIAEGIETASAFYIATGIPTWATINATGMEKVLLPNSVTEVYIAVDNDSNQTGQNSAVALSRRLVAEGRNVKRITPPKENSDFNDLLLEVGNE